ncbi:uncharacterized protein F4812DRAFT_409001 [Daldinia caldariorum]|uniref:uncharacterized protein n=1 Tax=Daldinia caldariorum TaxID=326644 RepID=UPI0020088616|nr:uncharacterized protein F4812DRAFT_409001 [Daldinia caldariorum]KAI1472468.1 hypothetical protein F4812DRAFT_409001 [Daldinia caldariorum]
MPLFSSRRHEEDVVEEPVNENESKRHGLFGSRHRSPSPANTRSSTTNSTTNSSRHSDASSPSRHRSVLQRTFGHGNTTNPDIDPSIVQARERVMQAEIAERDADRALESARVRVREARAEVKRIELEAAEEARRAKIKQYHAREVSKRGKQLGRHDV